MPTKAREYIALNSIGDLAASRGLLDEIESSIRAKFHSNLSDRRASFFCRILSNDEEVEDECLDLASVRQLTNGVFPILWLNITFDPDRVAIAELSSLESALSLAILADGSSERPFA
jgi:hypothetical protein